MKIYQGPKRSVPVNDFTEEQAATVRRLLASYEIAKVTGHNDHAAKLCPGFQVRNNRFIPD